MSRVGTDPLVHQIVYSMLLWDASHDIAARSLEQLRRCVVDFNELRVCSGAELRDMLPRECPRKEERTSRLLASLNEIFVREHGLNIIAFSTQWDKMIMNSSTKNMTMNLDTLGSLERHIKAAALERKQIEKETRTQFTSKTQPMNSKVRMNTMLLPGASPPPRLWT